MSDLRRQAEKLLRQWNIPAEPDFFHGDGWALVANLANWTAKVADYDWYDWKPLFVQQALDESMSAWIDGEIAYVETAVGQVSFHVFDEVEDRYGRSPRGWSGDDLQCIAAQVCREYIEVVT